MAFVVAGAGVFVWRVAHNNYSEYDRYDRHSKYREYGDSALRNEIENTANEIRRKEADVESLRRQMNENFNRRVNQLKSEKNYSGLNSDPTDIIYSVKADMRRELDAEIAQDKRELEEIDKMIARINEIELQSKR